MLQFAVFIKFVFFYFEQCSFCVWFVFDVLCLFMQPKSIREALGLPKPDPTILAKILVRESHSTV